MASVMAIGSEVFGSCVEGIDVSVEAEYGGGWLCCGRKYLSFIWGGKAAAELAMQVGDGARYWMPSGALGWVVAVVGWLVG
jgi:hypothetical protein